MYLRIFVLLLTFSLLSASKWRGVWLTTYDPQMKDQNTAQQYFTQWKSWGITKVYASIWNNGNLYAQSQTLSNLINQQSPDYLRNLVNAAKNVGGIEVIAWLEYGNMAAYGSVGNTFSQVAQQRGWLIGNGQAYNGFVWLNPSNNDVVTFLTGMFHDLKKNYGVKIQLDDHIGWPSSAPGPSASERQQAVNRLVQSIANSVSRSYLSIAPSVMTFSVSNYNADWPTWVKQGLVYEVIPQLYRYDYNAFTQASDYQIQYAPATIQLGAGVLCNGSSPNSWNLLYQMLQYVENSQYDGVVIWYAKCLYETYTSQFQQIWH